MYLLTYNMGVPTIAEPCHINNHESMLNRFCAVFGREVIHVFSIIFPYVLDYDSS